MEKNGVWHEEWIIASYMVGPSQLLRLKSCADIFQELANNHANFRNVGFEHMKAEGKFWVLNRQSISILEMPRWGEKVEVSSWISMMKGPFSLRHFAMKNNAGNILALGSYLWTSIDREKMKPVAFPVGDFPIVPDYMNDLPEPKKIKVEGAPIKTTTVMVRKSDLDVIGHSNNVSYLAWTENEINELEAPYQLDANYTGESHLGDVITIEKTESTSSQAIRMLNAEDKLLFKVIIRTKE